VVIDWGLAKSLDDVDAPDSLRPAARPVPAGGPARSAGPGPVDAVRPGEHTARR